MSPGKLAAQAGHAFTDVFQLAAQVAPERLRSYQVRPPLPPAAAACTVADRARDALLTQPWSGTKLVLVAPDGEALLDLYARARALGFPTVLVGDHGHHHPPHFDGGLIITALGLGPVRRQEHHPFTKRLRLAA